ncbi:MAG: 4Fe-4S dicluster domain-containing protein [Syntrophobacteraceae bacterium]
MNRRTFLKVFGTGSIAVAAGCAPDPYGGSRPDKTLYSLVTAPEDMIAGAPTWYATTCRECPAGCGVLAKNREGRLIKLEGNPLHPINQGKLCMRGQAALHGIYNPDRLKTPMLREGGKWRSLSFAEAQSLLNARVAAASRKGPNQVRMLTEVAGETELRLLTEALATWNCAPPLVFEPFAHESLKAANDAVFGLKGLPSYKIDAADVLVSFGAEFLETWLSPVEYARLFKAMHAVSDGGRKGMSFCIAPYQSLTAANADRWLSCHPGSEAFLALGLIREAIQLGRGASLPRPFLQEIATVSAPFTSNVVTEKTGVSGPGYETLTRALMNAGSPLVLGTGTAASGPGAGPADVAVNCLNWVLDPQLGRIDFEHRHRVEIAAARSEVLQLFESLTEQPADVLLLHNVNPVYAMPNAGSVGKVLENDSTFVVSFSSFMDETSERADLVLPIRLPAECWGEYGGKGSMLSTLQPAMGRLTEAPQLGDILLAAAQGKDLTEGAAKAYLVSSLLSGGVVQDEMQWVRTLQHGGTFHGADFEETSAKRATPQPDPARLKSLKTVPDADRTGLTLIAAPSIRFFDGRGANRPWLCEVPDPLTRVAWETPVLINPETLKAEGLSQGDRVRISVGKGQLEAPVYDAPGVKPGVMVVQIGQGHTAYGRYAKDRGVNPFRMLPAETDPVSGAPVHLVSGARLKARGDSESLAKTEGARIPYDRKIALSVSVKDLASLKHSDPGGLTMWDFPLTLPLPEGYDPKRDFYPPHDHDQYRWSMVVDMDRCIGCGACAVACYAENNIGIVGRERIRQGREMAWLSVERYLDPDDMTRVTFLPLMCQHCDNAPCEPVCPVYAPHHGKEGMNNQIYNRCIGTRFCSQNCPYKVRRFNWFDWERPDPMSLQLNPNVTVRSKGVMEKCSFCVQRIKEAHGWAKNENRAIRDGEAIPACVQTCPTGALSFGNLMDNESRVRKLVNDPRAYQVMGYLNTKPAVFYLRKVVHEI